jgi:hypothetical protein
MRPLLCAGLYIPQRELLFMIVRNIAVAPKWVTGLRRGNNFRRVRLNYNRRVSESIRQCCCIGGCDFATAVVLVPKVLRCH